MILNKFYGCNYINILCITGEQISTEEALKRGDLYKKNGTGCYIYYDVVGKSAKFW